MARVPQLTEAVALRPVEAPYQRIQTTPDDFGMGGARAADMASQRLERFADRLGQRVLEVQIEDNERDAKRMDVELSKRIRALGFGDGTEKNPGFYATKGQAAIDAFGDVAKQVEQAKRDVLASARNDRSRELIELKAEERTSQKMEGMTRHVNAERRVASDELSQARVNEALDDAAANWNSEATIRQSMAVARGEIESMALRNGWSPEVAASKLQAARTAIHEAVIRASLDRAPGYASTYYKANKADIDGRARPALEKALEAGSMRAAGQAAEDRIMAMSLPEDQALAEARKIRDPKLRDDAVNRVTARYGERARIEQRDERAIRDRAWTTIVQGGNVDNIPANDLARLDGTTIGSMQQFTDRRARQGRGFARADDPSVDVQIHRLFMDDKAAFAAYDMTQHYTQLTEERVRYWQGLQRSVDARGERDAAKQTSYVLGDRVAKQYLDAAKIRYGEGTPKAQAEKAARVFELVRGVADEFATQGKKPTSQDFDRALKELFLRGTLEGTGIGGYFATDVDFYQVARTPQAAQFRLRDVAGQKQRISEITGVPADDVEKIAKALEKAKAPVTAANIKKLYEARSNGR